MTWIMQTIGQIPGLTPLLLLSLAGFVAWRHQKRGAFLRRRERIARRILSS